MTNNIVQRLVALLFILLISPLLILIYLTIALFYQYNPIFVTPRTGLNQKQFNYYKFQTMYPIGHLTAIGKTDEERLTKLGFYLRKYSLDELPSVLCVLFGNLNFVGPRPLPPVYNNLYSTVQLQRFLVKPGITGLAQISGRNSISWKRKFTLDCIYVKKRSNCLDLIIILKTVKKVLLAKDVHPTGASAVKNFNGDN